MACIFHFLSISLYLDPAEHAPSTLSTHLFCINLSEKKLDFLRPVSNSFKGADDTVLTIQH